MDYKERVGFIQAVRQHLREEDISRFRHGKLFSFFHTQVRMTHPHLVNYVDAKSANVYDVLKKGVSASPAAYLLSPNGTVRESCRQYDGSISLRPVRYDLISLQQQIVAATNILPTTVRYYVRRIHLCGVSVDWMWFCSDSGRDDDRFLCLEPSVPKAACIRELLTPTSFIEKTALTWENSMSGLD